MTTYVYHYCASYQMGNGSIAKSDGVVSLRHPITSFAEYKATKAALGNLDGWPADGFTIDSFSFLHQTED